MATGKRNQPVSGHSERCLHHLSASETHYCTPEVRTTEHSSYFPLEDLTCTILVHARGAICNGVSGAPRGSGASYTRALFGSRIDAWPPVAREKTSARR